MKVTSIWLSTERQTNVAEVKSAWKPVSPEPLLWDQDSVCLSVWCEEGNWDHAQTRRKKEENTTTKYNKNKQKSLPWLGHWLKKLQASEHYYIN